MLRARVAPALFTWSIKMIWGKHKRYVPLFIVSRYRDGAGRWLKYFLVENKQVCLFHDDVIQWKHFPRYWPFVRGTHRSPVSSPHKGQWRGALMVSLICARINGWVNNREAGDLRRHHCDEDMCQFLLFLGTEMGRVDGWNTSSWKTGRFVYSNSEAQCKAVAHATTVC